MNTDNHLESDIWVALAYLRFCLATWVLFAHTMNFAELDRAMPVPSSNALVAVYCFLAISGFSIHHSIKQRLEKFALRRIFRIAPTHIASICLAIVAYLICSPVLFDGRGNPWPLPSVLDWLSASLLIQAFVPFARIAVLFPSWSLSVECVYYTIAPHLFRVSKLVPVLITLLSFSFCLYRPKISVLYIGSETYGISVLALAWAWLSGWFLFEKFNRFLKVLFVGILGSVSIWADNLLAGWFNYFAWVGTVLICTLAHGQLLNRKWKWLGIYLGGGGATLSISCITQFYSLLTTDFSMHIDISIPVSSKFSLCFL